MTDRMPPVADSLPRKRPISAGRDWRLAEYVCVAGPEDRPVEERHDGVLVAAVLSGTFSYHGDTGRGVLLPGSLMLGNHGTCYACGHEHSRGDRCVALHIAPEYFQELAASVAGSAQYRFGATHLPPQPGILRQVAGLETLAREDRMAVDEAVPLLIEALLALACGVPQRVQNVSSADYRRVARAVALLETSYAATIDLEELATQATTSKYHFLRVFRRVVGMTPYQYLLQLRLRHAALALATRPGSILDLAMESGFGDLSGFNQRFRASFGLTPRAWRAHHGRFKRTVR